MKQNLNNYQLANRLLAAAKATMFPEPAITKFELSKSKKVLDVWIDIRPDKPFTFFVSYRKDSEFQNKAFAFSEDALEDAKAVGAHWVLIVNTEKEDEPVIGFPLHDNRLIKLFDEERNPVYVIDYKN
ncbi:MAG: hypothetical protein J1F05_07975 [Muribaculaceae bacterium]|nr:hypothetical protein [Muribaculaceae bacterium]